MYKYVWKYHSLTKQLKRAPLISLYRVQVYSNEHPPWSKLCVANEAEFEKQRGNKQYFIKGYYKVAFNALCRRI